MAKEISDPKEVTELLKGNTPVVIFFYMNGCQHCERTMGPWKELTQRKLPYTFAQVESEHAPDVVGFPHFEARHKGGAKTSADGAKGSADEIITSLKLAPSGGRRRRTGRKRARRHTRRVRKVAH